MDVKEIQQKILAAKEETYFAKCKTINKHQSPIISLALNIPGWPKTNRLLRRFFFLVLAELKTFALAHRLIIDSDSEQILDNANGLAYFCTFKYPSAIDAKKTTEKFERSHKLGRFIDVDIIDNNCNIVSSGEEKACFICESKSAIYCMRNEIHSLEELEKFQHRKIKHYLFEMHQKEQSEILSELMLNSLLAEISLYPKPGLVSPIDSGSHVDMDYASFLKSTAAIHSTFSGLFNEIILSAKVYTFEQLREIGIKAENRMKNATGNLNTHKGVIFLMLIIGYVVARLIQRNEEITRENIKNSIKTFQSDINADPLNTLDNTHGNKVREKTNNVQIGIKAEITNGLPSLFEAGLPQLYLNHFSILHNTEHNNKTLTKSLLSIMSVLNDSNILYRGDESKLHLIKKKSEEALKGLQNNNWKPYYNLCTWVKSENLSPGGAADILVGSIFIYLCQINPKLKPYEL